MNAVILFSHGALLCGAGLALNAHAARLRERNVAPIVEVGYLNYSEPPFLQAVAECVTQGATRITVAPYFLAPGKFVHVDLPRAVESARQAYPRVDFRIAEAIGFDPALADAPIASAHAARPQITWRDDLRRAADHCRANPECPLFHTPACPKGPERESHSRVPTSEANEAETQSADDPSSFLLPPSSFLLVMAHGSPRPTANDDLMRVVEVLRARRAFPGVEVSFLECNAPSIPDAIDACVMQGAARIRAVPYFLHTGGHVADDLPTLLEEGQRRHPGVDFLLGDYLGRSELLTDILQARILAAP